MNAEQISEEIKNLMFDKHTHAIHCHEEEIVYKHEDVLFIIKKSMELMAVATNKK